MIVTLLVGILSPRRRAIKCSALSCKFDKRVAGAAAARASGAVDRVYFTFTAISRAFELRNINITSASIKLQ